MMPGLADQGSDSDTAAVAGGLYAFLVSRGSIGRAAKCRCKKVTIRGHTSADAAAFPRGVPPNASDIGTMGWRPELLVVGRYGGKTAKCPASA
jgi:hypothetical protein